MARRSYPSYLTNSPRDLARWERDRRAEAARIEAAEREAKPSGLPQTVKRADLFGNVIDTYATEGELNGWREQQSALIGRQGGLL